jgi:hypothetical protein
MRRHVNHLKMGLFLLALTKNRKMKFCYSFLPCQRRVGGDKRR